MRECKMIEIVIVVAILTAQLVVLVYIWAKVERGIESLLTQGWAVDALDDNVRYLANTLTAWHAMPTTTPEEKAERDKDVADIQMRLYSPGPGLLQWDRTRDVRSRYGKSLPGNDPRGEK